MKNYQKLELTGAAFILLGLFFQFFVAASIEKDMKSSDSYELELRLQHIYHYVKTGEDRNPSWDSISEHAKGPSIKGDNHWQFQEVYYFATPAAFVLFILGSILGLLGKYLEYSKVES